ncbi:MAG: YfhO family protein [Candidatus Hydrogenedentes bacterium]|nr:YfhO family protein [Candidatus Hydrogenedentota bacterium]
MKSFLQTPHQRFSPVPLFFAALLFILCSPVFWINVESRDSTSTTLSGENQRLVREVYPRLSYGYERLAKGDLPLWNNEQLCGIPFFADPRNALAQPLNLLFLFFESSRAMVLHAFIALSLMGFFFTLYLRSMGLRYVSAALGGVTYMCCGATTSVMSHSAYVPALVWLPLLCLLIREYTLHQPRPALIWWGSLISAFIGLSGSFLINVTALSLAYGLGLTALLFGHPDTEETDSKPKRYLWARLRGLFIMAFLGLLLTAVQWVPTFVWIRDLAEPLHFLTRFDLASEIPFNVKGFLAQLLEAHSERGVPIAYFGMGALLLAPIAFFHGVQRWERFFFFGIPVGVWLLIFIWGTADRPAPGFVSALAYPAAFAGCVLTALGADRLFMPRRRDFTPRLWAPLLLVLLLIGILFILAPAHMRGRILPVPGAVLFFALFRRNWAAALSGMLLLCFQFVDLNTTMVHYQIHPFFVPSTARALDDALANRLHETTLDDRCMVFPLSGSPRLHPNMGMLAHLSMINALGLPLTKEQQLWQAVLDSSDLSATKASLAGLLNVMAVRSVAVIGERDSIQKALPITRLRPRGVYGDIHVFANEDVLPRISWAQSWQLALDGNAALEVMGAPEFNSRQKCVIVPADTALSHLVQVLPERMPLADGAATGSASRPELRLVADQPEKVSMTVETRESGILVLSDSYARGWRAYVDGKSVPVLRVNGLFRGIALSAGKHEVSFYYIPLAFYIGVIFSLLGLFLLVVLGIRSFLTRPFALPFDVKKV